MEMDEYQRLAGRTTNVADTALANFALGLAGEAGEVADMIKKHIYHGHDLDRNDLIKELGDVLWYVSQVAAWNGINMNTIAVTNVAKLRKRYPEGFSQEASQNREDDEE